MLSRRQGRARAGFTLVELLMVITIIGLLVGMGSYAAFQAIATGQNASIALDIQSLNAAMQSYKADHKQYPPDLSDLNYSYRQTRFQNHIGLAFPRCGTSYGTLKSYILNNTYKSYGYNYISSSGSATPLNLDTMDQAEALVFWLGGFPTPYTQTGTPMPLASRKLFGFHTDVTNPFRLDSGTAPISPTARRRCWISTKPDWSTRTRTAGTSISRAAACRGPTARRRRTFISTPAVTPRCGTARRRRSAATRCPGPAIRTLKCNR